VRIRITPDTARAWVDVDLDALVRNARSFAEITGAPLLPMVKANGYGLGAVPVARALGELDPWGYGVATVDEARELHLNGIVRPIIVFTPLVPSMVEYLNAIAARPAIGDLEALRAWLAQGIGPFHIDIDTGMGRSGFRWDDNAILAEAGNLLADAPGWEGAFTALHSAERDPAATAEQWKRLQNAVTALGRRPALVHAAASAAGAYGTAYAGDLGRPGIHLYGGRVAGLDAVPVAALRARVVAVRRLGAGDTVGYDATWQAPNQTTVATLAIGYADGVHRRLSNGGAVELLGQRLRIVGRISMDLITIDAGDLPVSIGDVATLFGGVVTLEEQAALAGTISYELLTSLGDRLPRRYLRQQ
jgi:alanine racemase